MYRECCIPGCNSHSKRKDVMLHKMPAASEKVMLWHRTLTAVPFTMFEGLTWGELGKLYVCHKHFEAKYVTPNMRLKPTARPTLFTLEEMASGKPAINSSADTGSMEIDCTGISEHSYARKRHYDHTYAMSAPTNDLTAAGPSHIMSDTVGASAPFSTDQANIAVTEPSAEQTQSYPVGASAAVSADQAGIGIALMESPAEQTPPHPASASSAIAAGQACSAVAEPSNEQTPENSDLSLASGVQAQDTKKQTPRTIKWVCRTRLVTNVENLSPECKELYKHYKKAKHQVNYLKRAKMASKLSKEASFQQLVSGMNPVAKKFLWMQIKLCTKKKQGRRFSLEEKVIALSIMKQSPKCYRFLQRIFILPCKTTLNNLLTNVNIEPGINPQVFNVIKEEVSKWPEAKRLCTIIFDEMKLEAGVHYSRKHDKIDGFVELSEKTNKLADHALAFIIKGAVFKWQQPMAFYFSKGAAAWPQMKVIIKDIVAAVVEAGLQPIALISDQGSSFQTAFKKLQEDTRSSQIIAGEETDDTIHLNGQCLSVVFDPPHLIKGIRNNFLTKDIEMEGKVSKWQDLVDVYRTDCGHAQARLLHKINDEHILPEKIKNKKMKVKNCVRVFSQTMAGALAYTASFSHYADGTPVSPTLSNTAELVEFLDDLFDSVNGTSTHHKQTKGKKLRSAVTENSDHHAFWERAIRVIQNMKFKDGTGKSTTPDCLKNWIITLKSYQRLWQVLKTKNINIMRPRYFNSDAIEIFFGRVRSYNARNNDPTCHAFECTFKSLLITNLINFHENTYNCEEDCAEQVIKIQSLFLHSEDPSRINAPAPVHMTADPVDSAPSSSSTQLDRDDDAEQLWVQATRERLNVHSRAYTAGWVTRKVLKTKCKDCEKDLTTEETNIHKWISQREYNTITKNKLTYPAEHVVRAYGDIVKETNAYLEHNSHKNNIKKQITDNLMSKYAFDFIKCETHRGTARQAFISIAVILSIFNWCNTINRILRGTDVSRLNLKNLPPVQAQAYDMYKKRLKNKSLYK